MFAPADYTLRPLMKDDEGTLWEMLYLALRSPSGEDPPRGILRRPEYARYVEGWGRSGDIGFIAHDKSDRIPLGAVWFRQPPEDEVPPELAFVVKPGHRQHGIGASLLTQMVRANPQLSSISLRMGANSPAVRLFGRFGFEIDSQGEQALVMRRGI
ncbi:MAG TPA: GNAT family N-acetyltransferase [Chthoniobacterales bacterium]|jgi:GNAT superfamily N-acetyltransferase